MSRTETSAELRRLAAKCYRKAEHALSIHAGLRAGGMYRAETLARLDGASRAWHAAGDLAEQQARTQARRAKAGA